MPPASPEISEDVLLVMLTVPGVVKIAPVWKRWFIPTLAPCPAEPRTMVSTGLSASPKRNSPKEPEIRIQVSSIWSACVSPSSSTRALIFTPLSSAVEALKCTSESVAETKEFRLPPWAVSNASSFSPTEKIPVTKPLTDPLTFAIAGVPKATKPAATSAVVVSSCFFINPSKKEC